MSGKKGEFVYKIRGVRVVCDVEPLRREGDKLYFKTGTVTIKGPNNVRHTGSLGVAMSGKTAVISASDEPKVRTGRGSGPVAVGKGGIVVRGNVEGGLHID